MAYFAKYYNLGKLGKLCTDVSVLFLRTACSKKIQLKVECKVHKC